VFDPNILTVGTGLAEHNNYGVDFFKCAPAALLHARALGTHARGHRLHLHGCAVRERVTGPDNPAGCNKVIHLKFSSCRISSRVPTSIVGLRAFHAHLRPICIRHLCISTLKPTEPGSLMQAATRSCRASRVLKKVCPGCKISGGVSNIAFSFRGNEAVRRAFHSAFLHWGSLCGMDMGIVNAAQVCCCAIVL
jgi:hypothetical protein